MVLFKRRKMKKELLKALADDELTDEELDELNARQAELGITDAYINTIRTEHFEKRIAPVIRRINASRRFTPDDEREIQELADRLRVTPQFGNEFTMYRNLWEIETTGVLEPKPIDAGIRLTRNEECYHWCPAIWKQAKTVRQNMGYVGGSVGFRVAKGVTLRVGRAVPQYREFEDIVEISDGNLYVTSKKLVFVGTRRSTNVTYGRLVHYELAKNAVELLKTSGKPDIFMMSPVDVEYVDALLQVVG